jgi:hypothetical protein
MMIAILTACATFAMAWGVSPASASAVMETVAAGEYREYMDYNGDGELSVMDAIGIMREYDYNSTYGNTMAYGESDVWDVVTENLNPAEYGDYFYYEIDFIDGSACRKYEISTDCYTVAHVYCEVNDTTFQYTVGIDPITETATVLD